MDYKQILEEKLIHVNTLISKEETKKLCQYASKVPSGGTIVEIGTAAGGSAFPMAFASKPSVKLYTIDPNRNETFIRQKEEWGLDKITFVNKTSEDAVDLFADKKIDLLFIDGIHNYLGVMNDFNWYSPRVKKGGIIIFHDYFLYRDTIGAAVDEICSGGTVKKIEIIDSLFREGVRTGMFITRKLEA